MAGIKKPPPDPVREDCESQKIGTLQDGNPA